MKSSHHPVERIAPFLSSVPEDVFVRFSVYQYRPQCLEDTRLMVMIPRKGLNTTLACWGRRLGSDLDLAFHSEVMIGAREQLQRHLLLVDLAGEWREESAVGIRSVFDHVGCHEAAIYTSGRSYHVYGFGLVDVWQWRDVMCRLLALNVAASQSGRAKGRVAEVLLRLSGLRVALEDERGCRMAAGEEAERIAGEIARLEQAAGASEEAGETSFLRLWRRCCRVLLRLGPDTEDVVDSRWIAHRLLAGYASLRWTSHQRHYCCEPAYWTDL